jgi:polyhydroxyalkanoate synthesis regulator phasin
MTQEQERGTLKAEVESLEEVLENLRKRLQELEAKTKEE